MQRNHTYPYGFGMAAPTRYAAHGTSSAQSPSANPDEDWTKISDLAERRRIQNRIAQRNYRKKLKRRLEDLERRAGSSSASPEQKPVDMAPNASGGVRKDKRRSLTNPIMAPQPKPIARSSVPPPSSTFAGRDDNGMFAKQFQRQLSTSPPPTLTYSYGPAEGLPAPPPASYPQHGAQYSALPAPFPDYQAQSVYLPPLPMARAGYGSYEAPTTKATETQYAADEMMNNFNFSYASVHGIEAPATSQPYDHAYAQPASDNYGAYGRSRTASPVSQSMASFNPPHNLSPHPVLGF